MVLIFNFKSMLPELLLFELALNIPEKIETVKVI